MAARAYRLAAVVFNGGKSCLELVFVEFPEHRKVFFPDRPDEIFSDRRGADRLDVAGELDESCLARRDRDILEVGIPGLLVAGERRKIFIEPPRPDLLVRLGQDGDQPARLEAREQRFEQRGYVGHVVDDFSHVHETEHAVGKTGIGMIALVNFEHGVFRDGDSSHIIVRLGAVAFDAEARANTRKIISRSAAEIQKRDAGAEIEFPG